MSRRMPFVALAMLILLLVGCAQRSEVPAEPEVAEETQPPTQEEPLQLTAEERWQAELLQQPIRFYLDRAYAGTDNPRQRLDVLLPENPTYVPMPAVLYLHSGAWQSGDKRDNLEPLLALLQSGNFAVVLVNYRLTDESIWPAQLHDVKAAIRWLRARSSDFGIDPQRLALWGDEAGGHLALMAAVTNQAQDMAGNLGPYTHIRSDVLGVVNRGGVTDIPALLEQQGAVDRASGEAAEAKLLGGLVQERPDTANAASPIYYVRASTPPILSVHYDNDPTVPYQQAERLHQQLQQQRPEGTAGEQYLIRGITEPNESTRADEANRIMQFFERLLLGRNVQVDTSVIE